jgi:hypothetical protein
MAQNYSKIGESTRIINNALLINIRNYDGRRFNVLKKKVFLRHDFEK